MIKKKMKSKPDADMFGRVENQGWDPDGGTPIVQRNGINRQRQILDPMAQVSNIRSDATPMGDDYS